MTKMSWNHLEIDVWQRILYTWCTHSMFLSYFGHIIKDVGLTHMLVRGTKQLLYAICICLYNLPKKLWACIMRICLFKVISHVLFNVNLDLTLKYDWVSLVFANLFTHLSALRHSQTIICGSVGLSSCVVCWFGCTTQQFPEADKIVLHSQH